MAGNLAAAASTALGRGIAQVFRRILLEGFLAAWRAEVVGLALVVALEPGRLLVDGHLAYRVYSHLILTSTDASI